MTRAQAVQAIAAGIALVRAQKQNGAQPAGDRGNGHRQHNDVQRRGQRAAGPALWRDDRAGRGPFRRRTARKIDAIHRGIARNQPDAADPLEVLATLGGFDIAGLCGIFLGGALERLPIADGRIHQRRGGAVRGAALPRGGKGRFASHVSSEPAASLCWTRCAKNRLSPRGCIWARARARWPAIPLWDMALAVYDGCYSFAEGGITPYTPQC